MMTLADGAALSLLLLRPAQSLRRARDSAVVRTCSVMFGNDVAIENDSAFRRTGGSIAKQESCTK